MNIVFKLMFVVLVILLVSCGNSGSESSDKKVDSPGKTTENTQQSQQPSTETTTTAQAEDGPAIASVQTPNYVAKIHKAIVFTPKDDVGGRMFKVKEGHDMVVLDMSVKNTSAKELDMGQIMLSAAVTDDNGKKHGLNLGSIAAYTYTYPNPAHQPQYDKLWGKIQPNEFFRTVAYGLQVPKGTKSFTISLLEEGDVFNNKIPRHEMKFTIE